MSNLNRKGFMMAEVIIVSTIILGTLVGLYSIFTKMYVVYTERSYYYDVDAVYALRAIYKNLVDNGNINSLINEDLCEKNTCEKKNNYFEFINFTDDDNPICNYVNDDICEGLHTVYPISKALIVRYDESPFTNVDVESDGVTNTENNLFSDTTYDEITKGYFDYLSDSMDFSEEYKYMFIIELDDGNRRYYGNYRIR